MPRGERIQGGVIVETMDGTTWTRIESGTSIQLLGVDATGPDDVFIAGRGAMFRRDSAGWVPVKVPLAVTGRLDVRSDAIYLTTTTGVSIIQRDPSW